MLDLLPTNMTDPTLYDYQFLRTHCATISLNGKMDTLYIAMQDGSLTWVEISRAPTGLPGLEYCWSYDEELDGLDATSVVYEIESSKEQTAARDSELESSRLLSSEHGSMTDEWEATNTSPH